MQTRALLFTAPHQVSLSETDIPDPGPGEVLIETAFSCVSPGTELRCLAGQQVNSPPFPFIPGYALSGRIIGAGPGVTMTVGTAVFASGTQHATHARLWGGHCGHIVTAVDKVVPVPDGVDLAAAATAKLAAIAYHGVRLARALPHETVVVLGLGAIGRFAAHLHALGGARVIAADLSPTRRASAQAAGLSTLDPGRDLPAAFARCCPAGADVIVDATGAPAVLGQAATLARPRPWDDHDHPHVRLVIQGSYPDTFTLPYDPLFRQEITILTPRDNQRRDLVSVLDFMARGLLRPLDFIPVVGDPSHAPDIYRALRSEPEARVSALFDWQAR